MGHSHRFGPASFTSDLPQLADIPSSVACSKVLLADLGCVRASGDSLRAERCETTPGRLGARVIASIRVAFRHRNDVGTQDEGTFAAQWLAYALPCQRFANTLTGICA